MVRLLFAALLAVPLAAQEMPDSAQMALQMELAQPGPEHARLAALAGTWDVTFRSSLEALSFTGVTENRMILGGRFLESVVTAGNGGVPIEALTVIGFDRGPGVYTVVGFDTFGTLIVTGAGPWNPATNGADLAGEYDDRVTGHRHVYVFEWRVHSADHYTWDVVFLEGGMRTTVMSAEYRRR